MMIKFELKKIFVKTSSKIALILILLLVGVVCFFAVREVSFVNEKGTTEYGYEAIKKLKQVKREWKGDVTTKQLINVIQENDRINNSVQIKSEDIVENNIAYGWKQGFSDIKEMINFGFGKFQEYDYYRVDSVSKEEVGNLYNNRINNLKLWLETNAKEQFKFSAAEKKYILEQYEKLEVPLFYDYAEGWYQVIEYASTIIMIMILILGFLAADIFSAEFHLKTDAILFSTYHGRKKAVRDKILSGILMVSIIYWVSMIVYTAIVLGFLGFEGSNCYIQTSMKGWKSLYNITYIQEYLLVLLGGYIGTFFILIVTMYCSAKTRSTVLAVIVPFVLIFIPSLLASLSLLNKVLALLPDQLLQVNQVVKYFNLYQIGEKVIPALPILLIMYLVLGLGVCPFLYNGYRKSEIN